MITSSASVIRSPVNISLLLLGLLLLPIFGLWVKRQESQARPALIPTKLWRNKVFTGICISVFLTWGTFNAFEQMANFFFQEVQDLTALGAAVRFLPAPVSGALAGLATGLLVHRIRADWIVVVASSVVCFAPLLMAIASPQSSYWAYAFIAVLLNPLGADALFTISNLLITSLFPGSTQGLAGGVFNTLAQVGKSVGLAISGLVANSVTANSTFKDKQSSAGLLEGYRAAFFYCLAANATTLIVSIWSLRKIGKVGLKRE